MAVAVSPHEFPGIHLVSGDILETKYSACLGLAHSSLPPRRNGLRSRQDLRQPLPRRGTSRRPSFGLAPPRSRRRHLANLRQRRRLRPLPSEARTRAEEVVHTLLDLPADSRWLEQPNGRRAVIVDQASRGGLRITGDPTHSATPFTERTISLDDIGWTIVADTTSKHTAAS